MLDIRFIRDNKELVKERLAIKNFKELGLVDEVISLDEQRKKLQTESDNVQSKLNVASKEIGQLIAKKENEKAEEKKLEVSQLKSSLQPIFEQLAETENKLNEKILILPNLPSAKVPPGKTPEDNFAEKEGGKKNNCRQMQRHTGI